MYCKNCGKEIDDKASVCIHCGVSVKEEDSNKSKVNGLAIGGFVVALVSLCLGGFYFIAPIIAWVLCIVAICISKKYNSCNELAFVGSIISLISLAIWAALRIAMQWI